MVVISTVRSLAGEAGVIAKALRTPAENSISTFPDNFQHGRRVHINLKVRDSNIVYPP